MSRIRTAIVALLVGAVAIAGGIAHYHRTQADRPAATDPGGLAVPAQTVAPEHRVPPPPSHPPVLTAPPGSPAALPPTRTPQPSAAKAPPIPHRHTRDGKVVVNPARAFNHYRVGDHSVVAIYADTTVVWLGGTGGMVRYNTATREFKTYLVDDGLRSNVVLFLGKLQGKIAVGTHGGGLSLLDPSTHRWDHYGKSEGLADRVVYHAIEAANADVWIATGAGTYRVPGGALADRASWKHHTVASTAGGLPHDRVYRIVAARDGSVWFATRGGVARYRGGKWESWTHAQGVGAPRELINGGDPARGHPPLDRAMKSPHAGNKATFDPGHVAALEVGQDGRIWAGTRGAGLARFDGKAWRSYTLTDGLPSNQVFALHFDRRGQLWIGTENGLAILEKGRFRVMTTAQGLLGESVMSVTTDAAGGVWAGGFGGVAHLLRPGAS